MTKENRSAVVISASSDIGNAICRRWLEHGWRLFGTYRTESHAVSELNKSGVKLIHCDLSNPRLTQDACSELRNLSGEWDVLVMCPGALEPVGAFNECNFDEWEESVRINFTGQLRVIHGMLPSRRVNSPLGPCVLFFAGGGINTAPRNYSAYIASKIALIKMCELLDAEIPDTRFAVIGLGWVKTKIHNATIKAASRAGSNYQRTIEKLAGNECTLIERVLDCCDWLVRAPGELISGRNFSVVSDKWGTKELEKKIAGEFNMYKLRRYGNDWLVNDDR